MSQQFIFIQDIVKKELTKIIGENTKRQEQDINRGVFEPESHYNVAEEFNQNQDLMNDVSAEEFIAKNIRVRPQSGMTTDERDEKKSDVRGLMGDLGQSVMDEEEKFNQNANIDIDE
jgi:hypothetical protein